MDVGNIAAILDRVGQAVTLRRYSAAPSTLFFEAACRGFVRAYAPETLAGPVLDGMREIVLAPSALAQAQFPLPPARGDEIRTGGVTWTVESVDDTHSIGDDLAFYVLRVRG